MMSEVFWSSTSFLIAFGGAIGGILFSIKDKTISLPFLSTVTKFSDGSIQSKKIHLGVLSDVLFGISGGFVIFIILPSVPNPQESMGFIKIFSLAIIGGYCGRVLVERVANEQIESKVDSLQKKVADSEEKEKNTGNALRLFYQVINGREVYTESEIMKVVESAPSNVVVQGFGMLENVRKQTVFTMLGLENDNEEKMNLLKERLRTLVPLLSALIKVEESHPPAQDAKKYMHYHYASLAYLYKDMNGPNWELALEYVNKAISSHESEFKDIKIPAIYHFNSLIICVNLGDCPDVRASEAFDILWCDLREGRTMILESNEVIAPNLKCWIKENKADEISNYFNNNEASKDIDDYWEDVKIA